MLIKRKICICFECPEHLLTKFGKSLRAQISFCCAHYGIKIAAYEVSEFS